MAKFNIKEITANAFYDYVGPPYPGLILNLSSQSTKIKKPDFSFGKKFKGKKKITLNTIEKSKYLGGVYFLKVSLKHSSLGSEPIELPNEPLISLGLTKTIVETATVGKHRKGTVKEYICTEDYAITIRGICIDPENPNDYPTEQVKTINKLFEVNDALTIVNDPFFELFGIRKLVFKDVKFEEMQGQAGMQKYTITAVSDQDFFADLTEKNEQLTNLKTT
ncbi:hypothetical protein GON26_20530 [Flavobacterium sp. GA093]|uniref:DUF6046 domain-containing protein n=1 Tax=Flavobacterium hydrocarbonoxydans TaxID=2683249 RepID=A0A6I4NWA0_9FLAO|nr:DUF6046 domain-containing protein [Flavobacterium hydrocarbonoxydans]MWB96755.1 hypothetical protein [Flavobacterium hydrocarbonoxydans]